MKDDQDQSKVGLNHSMERKWKGNGMLPTSSLFTEHPFSVTAMYNKSGFVQRDEVFLYYGMYSALSLNISVKVPLYISECDCIQKEDF